MEKPIKSKDNFNEKRDQEKEIVNLMIDIYCKGNKHSPGGICPECMELKNYAGVRIDKCPFMETKTFCASCKVHCYKTEMREKIKKVMRYAGPRMLVHHPILTIKHIIEEKREKKKRRSEGLTND